MQAKEKKWEGLKLSSEDLEDIRKTMTARISQGLKKDGEEIEALVTYLPPSKVESGCSAIAIDLGGSNLRAALISFSPQGIITVTKGPVTAQLPSNWDKAGDFFRYQTDLALSLSPPPGLPIGYCFSYPTTATPDRDGILIRWNKQFNVPDVVGKRVGSLLLSAFRERNYHSSQAAIVNDTVASLLAANLKFGATKEFDDFIGLIVGTGTNMAAYLPVHLLAGKLHGIAYGHDKMAVNLESGNFHPPHLSSSDNKLDLTRKNTGLQMLEKTVSGRFMPQLFSFIKEGRTTPPCPETSAIFNLAYGKGLAPDRELALAIVNRSADLVAAGLAGLIDILKSPGKIGIITEGGVINNHREYRNRVREKLAGLLNDNPHHPTRFRLLRMENANLIGAVAALL